MKRIDACCAGSYYFDDHPWWIADKHRNGKFFYGIPIKNDNSKEKTYIDIGFRLCREETK